jgi:hypothetical protein
MPETTARETFFERSLLHIAAVSEGTCLKQLKGLKKNQPDVHRYLVVAMVNLPEQMREDLAKAALGSWNAATESCNALRRISAEDLEANNLRISLDLDLLERVDDPMFLLQHYPWLGPLALILPSAREAGRITEHHNFLLHAKTILDAFGQAARLSPAQGRGSAAREYEIRIALEEIDPEIFRVIKVSGGMKLNRLHRVIQTAMGWTNSHLHSFKLEGIQFGDYDPDEEITFLDESKFCLEELAQGREIQMKYTYDFGDNWVHLLQVKPLHLLQEANHKPVCLDGKWPCPPEDCGGPHQFVELLQILANPDHEDFEHLSAWAKPSFRLRFDLEETNEALKRLFR